MAIGHRLDARPEVDNTFWTDSTAKCLILQSMKILLVKVRVEAI